MKNRQIVLNLYEKGIFDIKDAINQVADSFEYLQNTRFTPIFATVLKRRFSGRITMRYAIMVTGPAYGTQRPAAHCSSGPRAAQ